MLWKKSKKRKIDIFNQDIIIKKNGKLSRLKYIHIGKWLGFFKDTTKFLHSKKNLKNQFLRKNNINKNIFPNSYRSITQKSVGKILQKLIENEKWKTKKIKLNLGQLLFFRFSSICIGNQNILEDVSVFFRIHGNRIEN